MQSSEARRSCMQCRDLVSHCNILSVPQNKITSLRLLNEFQYHFDIDIKLLLFTTSSGNHSAIRHGQRCCCSAGKTARHSMCMNFTSAVQSHLTISYHHAAREFVGSWLQIYGNLLFLIHRLSRFPISTLGLT